MSIGKFAAGTTLATPAVGGIGYVTYEQLTKEEVKTTQEVAETSNSDLPPPPTQEEGTDDKAGADKEKPSLEAKEGEEPKEALPPDGNPPEVKDNEHVDQKTQEKGPVSGEESDQ